jgi:3-oxosteroid 1-dehydrogenase
VRTAETIGELARLIGVDPDGLEATVHQFNGPASDGRDPAFGRGSNVAVTRFRGDHAHPVSPLVGPVDQAPFHALELTLVGTGIGASGIATTTAGQVLRRDGGVIAGLFAIGACASPRASGAAYNSGFTLSRSMTFGYQAARAVFDRTRRDARAAHDAPDQGRVPAASKS